MLEGPTGRLPRGRRPTFLRFNDERVIIGIDIRPTQTTVALADVNGRFTSQEIMATPSDPKAALDELIARVQRLIRSCAERRWRASASACPDASTGAPDGWSSRPTSSGRSSISAVRSRRPPGSTWKWRTPPTPACWRRSGSTTSRAATWWWSRSRRASATGVLVNGQLVRGLNGLAGEFGHVPLDPKGPLCGCGSRGCWEVFGSNRAALRYYLESSAQPAGLSFSDLLSRAEQGDTRAAQALETMAHYLGRGMRMIVAGLAPEHILVWRSDALLASFRPHHRSRSPGPGASRRRRAALGPGTRRRHGPPAWHGRPGPAEALRRGAGRDGLTRERQSPD